MRLTKANLQTVLQLSDDGAKLAWRILKWQGTREELQGFIEPSPLEGWRNCPDASRYPIDDIKMELINVISRSCGVEHLPIDQEKWPSYHEGPQVSYLNQGDPYVATLILGRGRRVNRFRLGCWGDISQIANGQW